MSVTPKYSPATETCPQETQSRPWQQRPSTARDPSDFFCYLCGEDGHFANKCVSPENYPQVIQKLLQAQRRYKQNYKSDNKTRTKNTNASVKRSSVNVQTNSLPKGLVGLPSTAQVKINGKPCTALMDSGSQVTIIFDSWYAEHLSHIQLNSVTGLAIWGLSESESSYPYKGYIQVELELPQMSKCYKVKSVPVLALVCPYPRCSESIPVLIGTNVRGVQPLKSRTKTDDIENINSVNIQVQENNHLPVPAVTSTKNNKDLPVAEVKWSGPGPLSIPPGTEYVAICKVKEKQDIGDSILILERAHSLALPPSVLVQPAVLFSKMLDPNNFLVLLRNESLKQTAIPVGTVIAYLHIADIVTDAPNPKVASVPAMESRSPYASPIVLARKKNVQLRMCVGYRTLNCRTIPDQYTVPRINDALNCLSDSKWFSVLDLRSGYYQIPMAEEDKEKTAFICPLGFFHFERMPQGITGAPATIQRLMEKAVGNMHMLEVRRWRSMSKDYSKSSLFLKKLDSSCPSTSASSVAHKSPTSGTLSPTMVLPQTRTKLKQ